LLCCSNTTDREFAIPHATNHVHVYHGDCVGERNERMIHVIVRTEQSFFFTAESDEDDGALQLWFLCAEDTSELDHAGSSGGVVIRAVMYFAGTRRETTFTPTTEMIVVSADDDVLVLENRIGAFKNTDDVVGGNFFPDHIDVNTEVTVNSLFF